ncbi:MAG TPA: glycosyltransferase family 4 protein [Planctomycetes bacterium]|nr:glycosyltransferase family 4 protein [Planctomycetota bacterium]HIJ72173.1 glycosyltransferase family 4 protein [Planctomycetota bacterium]
MIKTAIIIERADIALGGAERSVFELASQLSLWDVRVTVLAAKGRTQADNIKILCPDTGGKRTSFSGFDKALRNHLIDNHYDIIHSVLPFSFADVYQPRGGSYPEAIIRNAASYQNPVVSWYKMATHYANIRRLALFRAENQLCSDCNRTIVAAVSEYVKRQFKKHYGLSEERIVVVPNGIKPGRKVHPEKAAKLRRQIFIRLGITEAAMPALFLFGANNFRLKGLTNLIKALAPAARSSTARPIYLIVAGAGSSRKYRHLAKKLGVSERIVFLGRLRNIRNALSISDVAVLPSWYDPCSRFILEALAAAKPVITTRYNGAAELFVDKRHGLVIDRCDDVRALADAMCFYADPENAKKAGDAITQDNLAEKISIRRHAEQMVELYERILKKTENRGQKSALRQAQDKEDRM